MDELLLDDLKKMNYSDFVGFINQWNVLPGAYTTLSKWKIFSNLNSKSKILEVACTTGFSSRELAVLSGCSGVGFDISSNSIKSARYNRDLISKKINIDYLVADGYKFNSISKFSHIIIGAALKFFPDPEKMLNKCISLLDDGGYILASPFFVHKPIPHKLIKEFKKVFGITPTNESYKDIMKVYKGLEIIYEERNNLVPETNEEIEHYCHSTIKRACNIHNITSKKLYDYMYSRLYDIKLMSNKLRPYQGYTVLVLRYRKEVYPNRFVELF